MVYRNFTFRTRPKNFLELFFHSSNKLLKGDYMDSQTKFECMYCKRKIALHSLGRHQDTCYLNPKNIRNCKRCGKILKNEQTKYCSRSCGALTTAPGRKHSEETKRKISLGIKNSEYVKNLTQTTYTYVCQYCDKEFESNQKKKRKFCSRSCTRKGQIRIILPDDGSFKKYSLDCHFNFNVYKYPDKFDLKLLEKYGWYKTKRKDDPTENLNGVSRDHMISIREGFKNNIPPEIISHPANCQLMRHIDNNRKNTESSISLSELKESIKNWDKK